MSTAMLSTANSASKPPAGAVVRRFVWKEFRTLRGLWIGVAVLGALILWAIDLLSPPSSNHAAVLLATALATAVLYAVGAAAMTFSLEHEESTYDFLLGLPLTWGPLYLGKVSVVTASAVALAACLSVIGWTFSGFELPGGQVNVWVVVALFGIAILEGIAWGTLFSLLIKRPIVAAILTLVMASTAVNLAVLLPSSRPGANLKLISYAEAVPLRLAIVIIVMIGSALVARRWLIVGTAAGQKSRVSIWRRLRTSTSNTIGLASVESLRPSRRTMLARLLWQTWRDSRKLLILPIVIAAALAIGVVAGIVLAGPRDEVRFAVLASTFFFVPALYGSLAFSNDQRRRSYRFLAEHAARARYVWLARHIIWLGTFLIVSLLIWLAATAVAAIGVRLLSERLLQDYVGWGISSETVFELSRGTAYAIDAAGLLWFSILTAYSVGQFCSMLVRSDILAAFIALVLSIVTSAWAAVLFAWQLSGWLFLLPLTAALFWATWLRAPDWIAERNSWRAWLKPALPIIVVLGFIGVALPLTRLGQITDPPASTRSGPREIDVESLVAGHRVADTPEARETAAMYLRAAELLHSWEDRDPLKPWLKPIYGQDSTAVKTGDIDEARIPPEQREEFLRAKEERLELIAQAEAAAVKLAMEASARPTCRFDFDAGQLVAPHPKDGRQWNLDSYRVYKQLNKLLAAFLSDAPVAPLHRLLAALRMSEHLSAGQPSVIYLDQLAQQEVILEQIGSWAAADDRTKEELRNAIDVLTMRLRSVPYLPGRLIPDHLLVGDVVNGELSPMVLAQSPESPLLHLAYLANQLPWERERALLALETITWQNASDADHLDSLLSSVNPNESDSTYVRRWLRPMYVDEWIDAWVRKQPAAATSYLARYEYQVRVPVHEIFRAYCDNQVYLRAALQRVALAAYRLDHGDYPSLLAELVPDYLHWVPLDPYSGQHFAYRPDGLELPLHGMGRSNFERFEADTPLLWSVGAGHAHLKQWNRTSDFEENDSRELRVITEAVYVLTSDEPLWSGEPAFAFPLPK